MKINKYKLFMIFIAFLLFAGEAKAETACADLLTVEAWVGRVTFTYSYTGQRSVDRTDYDWIIEHSGDMNLRLKKYEEDPSIDNQWVGISSGSGMTKIYSKEEQETILQYGGKSFIVETFQSSGIPNNEIMLKIDVNTCRYDFDALSSIIGESKEESSDFPSTITETSGMIQAQTNFRSIDGTNFILSGSDSFPTEVNPEDDHFSLYSRPDSSPTKQPEAGSATVTWEFTPSELSDKDTEEDTIKNRTDRNSVSGKNISNISSSASSKPVSGGYLIASSVAIITVWMINRRTSKRGKF